jgi:hypothetical protein
VKYIQPFGKRGLLIAAFRHDNCDGWPMRKRWIKAFGLIRPVWIWKPSKRTFEVGFEFAGVSYTLFFE